MLTRLFYVLCAGLFCINAVAESDLRGSSDPDLLKRFPQSWIVEYSVQQVPEYRLATGPMKKIEGVIAPEQMVILQGQLKRITYRVPESHKPEEIFSYYLEQLDALNADTLFECDSRSCGSSNQWANNYFRVAELYGVDRTQFYLSAKVGDSHLALYTVKRGNRRVYAHIDLLRPLQQTAGSLSTDLLRQGFSWINDRSDPAPVLELLTEDPQLNLLIAGYKKNSTEGSLEQQIQGSRELAREFVQQLKDAGVESERLRSVGVGPAIPVAELEQEEGIWIQPF